MIYALNIGEDGRILSATHPKYAPVDAVIVDYLPDGGITDYLYELDENLDTGELNWEYVYDPLPVPEKPEPEQPDDNDYEARIAALEAELEATKILLGVE